MKRSTFFSELQRRPALCATAACVFSWGLKRANEAETRLLFVFHFSPALESLAVETLNRQKDIVHAYVLQAEQDSQLHGELAVPYNTQQWSGRIETPTIHDNNTEKKFDTSISHATLQLIKVEQHYTGEQPTVCRIVVLSSFSNLQE